MPAHTLNDVLSRTRAFHCELSENMNKGANNTESTRAQLLLDYLQGHEERLARTLKTFQETADRKQLDTWFYEFTQKHNVIQTGEHHKPFSEMTSTEIMDEVMNEHEQVIQLYQYLYGRAGTSPAHELLRELIDLEQHEAMRLSQAGNRAEDM